MGLRLEYIYLYNYEWFLTGLDKDEIEMEFDDEDDIIVITGDNGSGKSSLGMLISNPYARTERGYGIIEGKKGKREQIFIDESSGRRYKITHQFSPKDNGSHECSSYFTIIYPDNSQEKIVSNGSVYDTRDAIDKYFGFDKKKIKSLRLTCDDYGLVSKIPSQRRKYVRNFIDGLEEIDERLKEADKKYKQIKSEVKANEVKLEKYPDTERLKSNISDTKELVEDYQEQLEKVHKEIGSLDKVDQEYFEDIENKIEKNIEVIERINELKEYIDDQTNKDNSIQFMIDKAKGAKERLIEKIDDINDDMKQINKGIINLNKDIESFSKKKEDEEYAKSLGKRIDNIEDDIKKFEPDFSRGGIERIKKLINNVMTTLKIIHKNIYKKSLIVADPDEGYPDLLLEDINQKISKKKQKLNDLNDEHDSLINEEVFFMNDDVTPHAECKIDDCELKIIYEKSVSHEEEISEINMNIRKEKNQLERLEGGRNHIKNDIEWLRKFYQTMDEIDGESELLEGNQLLEQIHPDNLVQTIKTGSISNIQDEIQLLVERHMKYFEYKSSKEKLSSLSEMDDKENKLLQKFQGKKEKLEEKLKKDEEEKKELTAKLSKKKNKLRELRKKAEGVNYLKNLNGGDLKSEENEKEDRVDELKKKLEAAKKKNKKLNKLNKKEGKIQEKIESNKESLDKLNKDFNVMEHLEDEYLRLKKELKLAYGTREVLRIHLPVSVMDSYLENVKIHANNFLDNTDLPYKILDFEVTDKIFRIETSKNGREYHDVGDMSKGERALISLALMFANQKVIDPDGKYRMVVLDEVDSNLKDEKKEIFKEIVMQQTRNFGLSQLFIVTHNETFTKMNNVSHIAFTKSKLNLYDNKKMVYHHRN